MCFFIKLQVELSLKYDGRNRISNDTNTNRHFKYSDTL